MQFIVTVCMMTCALMLCLFAWQVFKEPLECPMSRPILSAEDVKGIFGNIVDIMDVHKGIQVRALQQLVFFLVLDSSGIFRREIISME